MACGFRAGIDGINRELVPQQVVKGNVFEVNKKESGDLGIGT